MRQLSHTTLLFSLLSAHPLPDDNQTSQPLLPHRYTHRYTSLLTAHRYTSPVIPTVNLTVQSDRTIGRTIGRCQSDVRLTPFSLSLSTEDQSIGPLNI